MLAIADSRTAHEQLVKEEKLSWARTMDVLGRIDERYHMRIHQETVKQNSMAAG